MESNYEDLKNVVTDRYERLFRYTIMHIFIVLIAGLLGKNMTVPTSKIIEFLNQFLGEVNPILWVVLVYLVFSNAITYLIRKESTNDSILFKAIQQGLVMEEKHSKSTFFQDFLHKFEGVGQLIAWACRIFPLAIFGLRFFYALCQLLEQSFNFPSIAQAFIGGFGLGAWILWLHRMRFHPLKALIQKKVEIFEA